MKTFRVSHPDVHAANGHSLIAACEEDARAHSSAGPSESRQRTWRHMHFRWVPTPSTTCATLPRSVASLIFEAPRLLFGLCLQFENPVSCHQVGLPADISTLLDCERTTQSITIFGSQSFSQTSDEWASLPQVDEPWSPNGPVCPVGRVSHLITWWPL